MDYNQKLKQLKRLKSFGVQYINPIKFEITKQYKVELPDNLDSINKTIQECHLCEFSKTRNKIALDSRKKAKVFFVDFRASIVENDTGIVFSGKAGEMLENMTSKVLQLNPNDIFKSNLIKCFSNNTNATKEADICKEYTIKKITLLKPEILILFSYESYQYLSSDFTTSFNDIKGKVIDLFGCKTMVTYSPKMLLRNPSLKKETLLHLKTIKNYF